jgi:hypothetical protein
VKEALPLPAPLLSAGETVTATPLVGFDVLTVRVKVDGGGGVVDPPPPLPPQAVNAAAALTASQSATFCCKVFIAFSQSIDPVPESFR